MFRRFMIVCWILFGIPACVALVSGATSFMTESDIQDFITGDAEDTADVIQHLDRIIKTEDRTIALAEEMRRRIRAGEWTGEQTEDDANAIIIERTDYVQPFKMKKERLRTLMGRKIESERIYMLSALLAATILLWNVIWHAGHWIWMGRKADV